MQIKNNNTYSIMYGMNFIKAGEVVEVDEATADALLQHPNVEEYVSKKQLDMLEEENAELKKRLAVAKQSKSPKSTQSTKKR